jgi:hypothetical protein
MHLPSSEGDTKANDRLGPSRVGLGRYGSIWFGWRGGKNRFGFGRKERSRTISMNWNWRSGSRQVVSVVSHWVVIQMKRRTSLLRRPLLVHGTRRQHGFFEWIWTEQRRDAFMRILRPVDIFQFDSKNTNQTRPTSWIFNLAAITKSFSPATNQNDQRNHWWKSTSRRYLSNETYLVFPNRVPPSLSALTGQVGQNSAATFWPPNLPNTLPNALQCTLFISPFLNYLCYSRLYSHLIPLIVVLSPHFYGIQLFPQGPKCTVHKSQRQCTTKD